MIKKSPLHIALLREKKRALRKKKQGIYSDIIMNEYIETCNDAIEFFFRKKRGSK